MKEARRNLWAAVGRVDAVCITTNAQVNRDGQAVMGRGCALEAAERWPQVRRNLGRRLQQSGNLPHILAIVGDAFYYEVNDASPLSSMALDGGSLLVSFPVKQHWRDAADPALILASALRLVALADEMKWRCVVLPRPGCGNGRLIWEEQVLPLLVPVLDDRFVVVSK